MNNYETLCQRIRLLAKNPIMAAGFDMIDDFDRIRTRHNGETEAWCIDPKYAKLGTLKLTLSMEELNDANITSIRLDIKIGAYIKTSTGTDDLAGLKLQAISEVINGHFPDTITVNRFSDDITITNIFKYFADTFKHVCNLDDTELYTRALQINMDTYLEKQLINRPEISAIHANPINYIDYTANSKLSMFGIVTTTANAKYTHYVRSLARSLFK